MNCTVSIHMENMHKGRFTLAPSVEFSSLVGFLLLLEDAHQILDAESNEQAIGANCVPATKTPHPQKLLKPLGRVPQPKLRLPRHPDDKSRV